MANQIIAVEVEVFHNDNTYVAECEVEFEEKEIYLGVMGWGVKDVKHLGISRNDFPQEDAGSRAVENLIDEAAIEAAQKRLDK